MLSPEQPEYLVLNTEAWRGVIERKRCMGLFYEADVAMWQEQTGRPSERRVLLGREKSGHSQWNRAHTRIPKMYFSRYTAEGTRIDAISRKSRPALSLPNGCPQIYNCPSGGWVGKLTLACGGLVVQGHFDYTA